MWDKKYGPSIFEVVIVEDVWKAGALDDAMKGESRSIELYSVADYKSLQVSRESHTLRRTCPSLVYLPKS
jgi:hypothetical protein